MDTIETATGDRPKGHPWVKLPQEVKSLQTVKDGGSVGLADTSGEFLGCGVLDVRGADLLWRRYSRAEGVPFDAAYIAGAISGAIERRGDEACQRLVSSDADYLPGLVVELFGDVVWISLATEGVRAHAGLIADVLKEIVNPVELVVDHGEGPKTVSGRGLKGRWIEVDEILYRVDLLDIQKPRFYLDQREQHPLVGSLCEGRAVLDLFSHSGAFALQALCAGAERAVAVDLEAGFVKAIGANAQRNGLQVEAAVCDASAYLKNSQAGEFDTIVLDPPSACFQEKGRVEAMHRMAFAGLPPGGLLATYCRDPGSGDFESLVAGAAAEAGREARIFARTSQPFDFPMLLNFPESQGLRGLILQML
jgi:23S rRNA (cytosine1962-C5)-methyltransferase